MKQLTIVIPTYNRPIRLMKQLSSLAMQGKYVCYNLVILDNCSDYDLKLEIKKQNFEEDFVKNITIKSKKINTRMGYNLASMFLFVDTKWAYFASDDDMFTENSLETILEYLEKYPDVSMIEFSLSVNKIFDDFYIHSVRELSEKFKEGYFSAGDLFYMGNNAFNMEKLSSYLGDAFEFSSQLIPFMMPVFHQLIDGNGEIVYSAKHVQKYIYNTSGDTWMKVDTILKFSELSNVTWDDFENTQNLFDIVFYHFSVKRTIDMLLAEKKARFRKYAYLQIVRTIFRRKMTWDERLYIWAFYCKEFLHIPKSFGIYHRILKHLI